MSRLVCDGYWCDGTTTSYWCLGCKYRWVEEVEDQSRAGPSHCRSSSFGRRQRNLITFATYWTSSSVQYPRRPFLLPLSRPFPPPHFKRHYKIFSGTRPSSIDRPITIDSLSTRQSIRLPLRFPPTLFSSTIFSPLYFLAFLPSSVRFTFGRAIPAPKQMNSIVAPGDEYWEIGMGNLLMNQLDDFSRSTTDPIVFRCGTLSTYFISTCCVWGGGRCAAV